MSRKSNPNIDPEVKKARRDILLEELDFVFIPSSFIRYTRLKFNEDREEGKQINRKKEIMTYAGLLAVEALRIYGYYGFYRGADYLYNILAQ